MKTSDTLLLNAESISVFRKSNFSQKIILDRVNLNLFEGKITTIIGPNGAGKTTLIKVLLGITPPDSGIVHKAPFLKVGYMPQKIQLNPLMPLTVKRFLQLASAQSNRLLTHKIAQTLHDVGASGLENQHLTNLSGGEMQRVMLAYALIQHPNLLILDEPDQGIDVLGQAELYHLINQFRLERGCGVLLVSHDLHTVMAASDEIICLNGHVCCYGHPDVIKDDPHYHQLFGQYIHHHDHRHDHPPHKEPS
jgi:zinc transport system ATP-binding protein